jgi:hypothetical protein
MSTDRYVYNIALRKKKVTDIFQQMQKDAAVDCELNYEHNVYQLPGAKKQTIQCIEYGLSPPDPKINGDQYYTYLPNWNQKSYCGTQKPATKGKNTTTTTTTTTRKSSRIAYEFPKAKGTPIEKLIYTSGGNNKLWTDNPREMYTIVYKGAEIDNAFPLYSSLSSTTPVYWFMKGQKNPFAKASNVKVRR